MSKKEFLKALLYKYFIIVTLINVVIFVLGSIFRPNDTFGYDAFLSPLVYGLISIVPVGLFSRPRELTLKQAIVREVIEFLVLEFLLIFFGLGTVNLKAENLSLIIGFALSIFFVYLLVFLISWLLDARQAKQMTENLLAFQKQYLDE